jgi:hypothetical protein
LLLTGVTTIISAALADNIVLGIIGVLLFMPGVQLVCSLIIAISVELRRGENAMGKSAARRTIGKLTRWSVLGLMAGVLLMIFLSLMQSCPLTRLAGQGSVEFMRERSC